MKKERGITLVALVVTIIVLLILAGIGISIAISQNGVVTKSKEAANLYRNAEKDEQTQMNVIAEKWEELSGQAKSSEKPDWNESIVTSVVVDGKNIPVPKGYTLSQATGEKNVETGLVLYQGEEIVTDSNKASAMTNRNQYVWVPVPDVTTMYKQVDGRKVGTRYSFTAEGSTLINNDVIYEPELIELLYVGINNSIAGNDVDSTNLNIVGAASSSAFLTQMQNEFDNMLASVEKYGGFYIGRYETGSMSSSVSNVPKIVKGNNSLYGPTWYYHYRTIKNISPDKNIATTGMIWGCQWDATMRWMQTSSDEAVRNYVVDSSDKGYFSGQTSSGLRDEYKVNNIYDMAGNVYDWTMARSSDYYTHSRSGRGHGTIYSGDKAAKNDYGYPDYFPSGQRSGYAGIYGSRAVLCIKP